MAYQTEDQPDFTPPPITPDQAGAILQSLGLPPTPPPGSAEGYGNDPTTGNYPVFGPGGGIDRFISNIPVLGGIKNFTNRQISEGPLFGSLVGTDPRFDGLTPGTPEFQQAQDERRQGFAFGILGPESGGGAARGVQKAADTAAFDLQKAVQRVQDLVSGGSSRSAALDAVEKEFPKIKIADVQTASLDQGTSAAGPFAKTEAGNLSAPVAPGVESALAGINAPAGTAAAGNAVTGERFITRPIEGTSRFDVFDNQTGKSAGMSTTTEEAAQRVADKRNGVAAPAVEAAPVEAPKPAAKPSSITKLSDDQLLAMKEIPDISPSVLRDIEAESNARAARNFMTPEAKLSALQNLIPREAARAIASTLAEHGGNLVGDTRKALYDIIDNAAASRGIPITGAERKSVAKAIIEEGKSIATIKAAKADPKTAPLAARAEQIAENARAGATPIQTVNDTIDAMADHASGGTLFPESAIDPLFARRTPEAGPFFGKNLNADVRAAGEAGTADTATLRAKGVGTIAEPTTTGSNQSLFAEGAIDPVFAPRTPESGPFFGRNLHADVRAAAEAGTADAATLRAKGVGNIAEPTTTGANQSLFAEGATDPLFAHVDPKGGGALPRNTVARQPFNAGQFLRDAIPNLANATRSIVAGADFSAAGRQAFPFLFSHAPSYVKGLGRGVQAMFQTEESLARTTAGFKQSIEATGINAGREGLYLADVGGGLVKGEERYQGIQKLVGKIPVIGGFYGATERAYVGTLNAVRTYSYLGSVKMYDSIAAKTGKEALSLADKQTIAKDINVLSGQGFKLDPKNTSETVLAVAKLSNGLGFAPKFTVARARLIPDTAKSFLNMAWDAGHGHVPNPADVEQVRLGVGYAAGVMAIWQVASAQGLKIGLDPHSTNFGKVDLGPDGNPEIAKATALLETLGFSTQNYSGRVYLDPGQGIGQDIRLLTQLIPPKLGGGVVSSSGKAYDPYTANGAAGQNSPLDIILNFFENKAAPLPGAAIRFFGNKTGDQGDITNNSITSLLIPLVAQSVLSTSGATKPGGSIRPIDDFPGATSVVDAEKQRLKQDIPTPPGVATLSADKQVAYAEQVKQATEKATNDVLKLPEYQKADDATKQALIKKASTAASNIAQKNYGLNIALTGTPQEVVSGTALALAGAGTNQEKGSVLLQIKDAGRLTPDVAAAIDAQRNQPDPKKPNYDLTADEYVKVHQLASSWAQAPAFSYGNPGEWAAAERARAQYMKLQKEFPPEKVGNTSIMDPRLLDFWASAANGNFALFYTKDGSRKTNLVSPERKAIESDPLWKHVGKKPDTTEEIAAAQ